MSNIVDSLLSAFPRTPMYVYSYKRAHTHLILSHLFVSIVCVEKANVTGTESQITLTRKRHLLTQKSSKRSERCSFYTEEKISRLHHEQYLWKICHSQKQTRVKSNFAFLQHPKKRLSLSRFNWWLAFGRSVHRSFFPVSKSKQKNETKSIFCFGKNRLIWDRNEIFSRVSWSAGAAPLSQITLVSF